MPEHQAEHVGWKGDASSTTPLPPSKSMTCVFPSSLEAMRKSEFGENVSMETGLASAASKMARQVYIEFEHAVGYEDVDQRR